MNKLIFETEHYINETLNLPLQMNKWKDDKTLPILFQKNYEFYKSSFLNQDVLFCVLAGGDQQTPSVLSKHHNLLYKKTGAVIVFLFQSLTSYQRNKLIEKNVSFIVPGNQLYLPGFGMDLREHIINQRIKLGSHMSIVSQIVLLYAFYNRTDKGLSATYLAEKFGYSIMSLSRALRELEEIGLGKLIKEGKSRLFFIENEKKQVWTKAIPYFRSPVKKRIFIKSTNDEIKGFFHGGLSSLSDKSMLIAPDNSVICMTRAQFNSLLKRRDIEVLPIKEQGCIDVEIWHYDPRLFSTDNQIDLLSLFLSLQDTHDDRIESALETLMKDFKW